MKTFFTNGAIVAAILLLLTGSGCQSKSDSESTSTSSTATSSNGKTTAKNEASQTSEEMEIETSELPSDTGAGDVTESASADGEAPTATDSARTGTIELAPAAPAVVTLGTDELTAGVPGKGPLTTEQLEAWIDDPANHQELLISLPMGLDAAASNIRGLDENPMTRAKVELGRQLYFDTRLSADNTVSCASCHHPDEGFARHATFGEGIQGQKGNRNSPVSYNRIISGPQFWDGRAESLEEQAKGPIENPIEMGNTHQDAVKAVAGIEGYQVQFAKVFPRDGITIDNIAKAIAAFERALVTNPAPYDYLDFKRRVDSQMDEEEMADMEEEDPEFFERYKAASAVVETMSASAIRGSELFFSEKSNCTACHAGANFSDEQYHNLGVGMDAEEPDLGRFKVTGLDADRGAFKTPTLRNVALSAPYMHDGSQATLEEVVEWYDKGGHPNPYLSDKMKKLGLTETEKADLVAFMKEGLTGEFPRVEPGRLPL